MGLAARPPLTSTHSEQGPSSCPTARLIRVGLISSPGTFTCSPMTGRYSGSYSDEILITHFHAVGPVRWSVAPGLDHECLGPHDGTRTQSAHTCGILPARLERESNYQHAHHIVRGDRIRGFTIKQFRSSVNAAFEYIRERCGRQRWLMRGAPG